MGTNYTLDAWDTWTAAMKARFGNDGHGKSLSVEARRGGHIYTPAIRRWATILGREAPPLLRFETLNPAFVEWMMGYPEGHVTRVPGLNKSTALRALGNACVPAQAEAAIRRLLARVV